MALVFVACFSRSAMSARSSLQNEELVLAIEQLRARPPDGPWLIPARLDDCDIPDLDIGGGRTLNSLRRADLFGERAESDTQRLIMAIQRILGVASLPAGRLLEPPTTAAGSSGAVTGHAPDGTGISTRTSVKDAAGGRGDHDSGDKDSADAGAGVGCGEPSPRAPLSLPQRI